MAAASSSCQESYDVFLNFRGKDTRNRFTAHLYEALRNEKIQTFMDGDKIVKGDEISPSLVTAMDKSMFCIVVLSKNYASSTRCLDELVQILKCKNAKKQTVLPIFYDVNPCDVGEQKGTFGKAFAKLEKKFKDKMERVQIWKQALTEVANISGWDARNRHEPTLIREIIQCISDGLINGSSKGVEAIVRIDSHLQVKAQIPVPNIPTLPGTGERSEFPLSQRKINQVKETDIWPSTNGEWREIPVASTRKVTHTSYFTARDLYTRTSNFTTRDLFSPPDSPPHSPPSVISPPTSPRP